MRVVPLTRAKGIGNWRKPCRWAKSVRESWVFTVAWSRWQLVTDPRLGTWYSGYWEDGCYVNAFALWPGFRGLFMLPRKKAAAVSNDVAHLALLETVALKKYPAILAHCAALKYEDGTPRKPGRVKLYVQGDMWCVELEDMDTAKRVRALGPDVDKALLLANGMVSALETPWEDAWWLSDDPKKKKGRGG